MTLQSAAIRRFDAMTAICSKTDMKLHSFVEVIHYAEYRMDPAEERAGIKTGVSVRLCPSVPLVHKRRRDKDFAIWCSCCQSAVCPLRLRAEPLRVHYEESDSLVPYLMQDLLLNHFLAPCAVFMYKMLKLFLLETFASVRKLEREGKVLVWPGKSCLDSNLVSDMCIKTCKHESFSRTDWLSCFEIPNNTLRTAISWMTKSIFDPFPAAKQLLRTSRWWCSQYFQLAYWTSWYALQKSSFFPYVPLTCSSMENNSVYHCYRCAWPLPPQDVLGVLLCVSAFYEYLCDPSPHVRAHNSVFAMVCISLMWAMHVCLIPLCGSVKRR